MYKLSGTTRFVVFTLT